MAKMIMALFWARYVRLRDHLVFVNLNGDGCGGSSGERDRASRAALKLLFFCI